MKKIKSFCIMLTMAPLFGFSCERVVKEKELWSHIWVKVSLKRVKYDDSDGTSLLYGNLEIEGRGQALKSIDLNCVALHVEKAKSQKLYVDSVASVLTQDYPAKDNHINANVYWLFNQKIQHQDLKQAHLFRNPIDGCAPTSVD